MEVAKYLCHENVILDLQGRTHDEVINELVDVICAGSYNGNRRKILECIYNVEDIKNTAVGRGVAIPHARTELVPHIKIALGRCDEGIDWGAPDGEPVKLVWLIVNPQRESGAYLEILSQITKISVRQYSREAILRAKNPGEVIRVIAESKCRRRVR